MTDDELVTMVAEKVMGWKLTWEGGISLKPGFTYWRPLESWDDVMMVVRAMREKGFWFEWIGDLIEFVPSDENPEEEHPDRAMIGNCDEAMERRAILQAALAAVEAL